MKPKPENLPKGTDSSSRATETPRTPGIGAPCSEAPPFAVPDHTLLRRIGRGSYGEVWLARSALGTWRAVKIVLRSTFDDDRPYEREFAGIQRFEPISRSHESQLNVLQVGRVADGFYYVMELADDMGRGREVDEGTYTPRDLRSEMHLHGRLPVANCLRLGLALTTALEHLHKHGLVHRDVKPSNIVFVSGIPKLADIGLVAQAEATMSFVGTEGFVPPEGPGTRQADIYSLGKVLYELSTGHDRKQFPELPTGLESLPDGDQLGELNEVLLKACQRNPTERYQTAAEMHADLALLDSGRSVIRMRGMERRLRFVQRAGAIVTLIAALAAGLYLWQARQTTIVRGLVEEKSRLAEEKTKLADTNERLADENRKRIVRLGVANGVSLMDQGDSSGALLWFANALTGVTNTPEESVHRIRIQQALNQTPRLMHVLPPDTPIAWAPAWSPDGKRVATTAFHGRTAVWDVETGSPLWKPITLPFDDECGAQFMRDGRRFWVHGQDTVDPTGTHEYEVPKDVLAMIETDTGQVQYSISGPQWEHLASSPKDKWFAIVDKDHVIHLHDATDGRELAQLRGHTNKVALLEFSPSGDRLASTGADRSLRLWHLPSGELTIPPLQFEFEPRAVRFSPDGRILAVAQSASPSGTNSTIDMWEVNSGRKAGPTIKVSGLIGGVIAFVPPEGKRLFCWTDKDNVLFDTETGERLLQPLPANRPDIKCFSISADGRRVAFGGERGFLGVWSLDSGERVFQARLGGRDWTDINFSSDGLRILATWDDGTAVEIDNLVPQRAVVRRLSTPMGWPGYRLRPWLSADRRRLLLRRDGAFSVFDLDQLTDWQVPEPDIPYSESGWSAIDASGRQCAIHYLPKESLGAHFLDLWREDEKGWNRVRIQLTAGLKNFMQFSPDGTQLMTPGEDNLLRFWRTSSGAFERSIELSGDGLPLPDGTHWLAITGPYGHSIQDLVAGTSTAFIFPSERGAIHIAGVAIAPTGHRLALESGGSSTERFTYTYILSTITGQMVTPVLEHGGPMHWADFSPDGRKVLTTGLTPYVRVWNAESGEQLMQLDIGSQPVRVAQWSLDGRFIVARSDERAARVWDSTTGEAVTPIFKHASEVRYAILAQQNRLITLSQPDLISVWELKECELPLDVVADYAKYLSGRYLSVNGVLMELKSKELAELGRSLRQRAPRLFE